MKYSVIRFEHGMNAGVIVSSNKANAIKSSKQWVNGGANRHADYICQRRGNFRSFRYPEK